jgi:hypothetical protein
METQAPSRWVMAWSVKLGIKSIAAKLKVLASSSVFCVDEFRSLRGIMWLAINLK